MPTATPTNMPARKVTFAAFSGAVVTLIVGILNTYVPFFVQKPVSGTIATAATTVVAFIVSYFVRPGDGEGTITDASGVTSMAKVTP
jgi:hypothetical protein